MISALLLSALAQLPVVWIRENVDDVWKCVSEDGRVFTPTVSGRNWVTAVCENLTEFEIQIQPTGPEPVAWEMPNIVGLEADGAGPAEAALDAAAGFKVVTIYGSACGAALGHVVETRPAAGTLLQPSDPVTILVSTAFRCGGSNE